MLSTPAAGAGFGDPDETVHGRPRKRWHRDRLAAQRYLLRLIEESGEDCDLQQGVTVLAPSHKSFEALAQTVESRNSYYETSDYMVQQQDLGQEAGGRVAELFAGALVMADAHVVHPAKMITSLGRLARAFGARICERTEVVNIQLRKGGFRVLTNGGETLAQHVMLATGGYTGGAVPYLRERTLGLPSIATVSEAIPPDEVQDICRSGRVLLVNRYRGYSCQPTPDGERILLGGPVGQVPTTPRADAKHLHDYFTKLFPDLKGIEFTHCWTGMIAATRDRQGHAGAHKGIWYAVGSSGLVSCADAGRRMAQHILHDDEAAAGSDPRFPRWPLRESEQLLRRSIELTERLRDLAGKSRVR